jgi:hypothetical protein
VLPSLGETAVALRSLGEVVDGIRASRRDEPAVAEVKGSARMAEVLRRASRQAVPGAPTEFRIFYRDDTLVLSARELGQVRRQLLGQGRRNRQVGRVASALVDALWRRVRGERAQERGREEFVDTMLAEDRFLLFVRDWWPAVEATEVLGWLRDPELLARVSEGVLTPAEVELLGRGWGADLSVEDVALVDEIRYQVGDPPERSEEEEPDPLAHLVDANMPELTTVTDREFSGARAANRTEDDNYAHVLVDEAQDLSPMQWRMVGRRGRSATWTVVGDPAQSSWPHPEEAAREKEAALYRGPQLLRPRHAYHLGTNYRNSAEIYRYAAAYAERVGLAADLPDAVRSTGVQPVERYVGDVEQGVRAAAAELLGAVEGTVAVVVPAARRAEVDAWTRTWPEVAEALTGGDAARLVVLDGVATKGLEFDGIVVVEPDEIEDESPTGKATLYVVLTRATQRLVLVRGSAVPAP